MIYATQRLTRGALSLLLCLAAIRSAAADKVESTNVMAPLLVTDRGTFQRQLRDVKAMGVDAVSTDVWWGLVEKKADQQFDWSYYD